MLYVTAFNSVMLNGKAVESFERSLGAILFFITSSGCIMSLYFHGAVNLGSSPRYFWVALASSAVAEHHFEQWCRNMESIGMWCPLECGNLLSHVQ